MAERHAFALSNTYYRDNAWNRLMQVRGGRHEMFCEKYSNDYGRYWYLYSFEPLDENPYRTRGNPRSKFDYNRDDLFWSYARMVYFERDDHLRDLKSILDRAYNSLYQIRPDLYNQVLEKYNWYIDQNNNPYALGIKRFRDECNNHWRAYALNRSSLCGVPFSSSSKGGFLSGGGADGKGGR